MPVICIHLEMFTWIDSQNLLCTIIRQGEMLVSFRDDLCIAATGIVNRVCPMCAIGYFKANVLVIVVEVPVKISMHLRVSKYNLFIVGVFLFNGIAPQLH